MTTSRNDSFWNSKEAQERAADLQREAAQQRLANQVNQTSEHGAELPAPVMATRKPRFSLRRLLRALLPGTAILLCLTVLVPEVHAQGDPTLDPDLGIGDPATFSFILGFNALNHDDYDRAIMYFTRAIEERVDFASAYAGRALTHYLMQNYEAAIHDFTQAVVINPDYVSAYNWRGRVYLAMGDYENALLDAMTARELDPVYPGSYWTAGDVYFAQGRFDDALESYEEYVTLAGDEVEAEVLGRMDRCRTVAAAASTS